MSEALDHETKRHGDYLTQLLNIAIQVAEHDRTERLKGTMPEGLSAAAYSQHGLTIQIFDRYSNCYLIVADDLSHPNGDVIYLPKLLETAYAWILTYDSQHTRWRVDSTNIGKTSKHFFERVASIFPNHLPLPPTLTELHPLKPAHTGKPLPQRKGRRSRWQPQNHST